MKQFKIFGVSEKAILAFFFPFIGTCVAVLSKLVVDGKFDSNSLRVGIAGLLASGLAVLGAYVGRPSSDKIKGFGQ